MNLLMNEPNEYSLVCKLGIRFGNRFNVRSNVKQKFIIFLDADNCYTTLVLC